MNVLQKDRATLDDALSADASQCLSLYPVLKLILQMQEINCAATKRAVESFEKLCTVLDLCKQAAYPGRVSPKQLNEAILAHLKAYKAAYGQKQLVPKFHLSIHLPIILHIFLVLLSCFVLERKHKEIKRFGDTSRSVSKDLQNTNWEKGVMMNILRVQLCDLEEGALPNVVYSDSWKPASTKVQSACETLGLFGDVRMSINVVLKGYMHVHQSDVVSLQLDGSTHICEVWYHLKVGNMFKSCVSVWQVLPAKGMFLVQDCPILVDTQSILSTVTYRRVGSTVLIVPAV